MQQDQSLEDPPISIPGPNDVDLSTLGESRLSAYMFGTFESSALPQNINAFLDDPRSEVLLLIQGLQNGKLPSIGVGRYANVAFILKADTQKKVALGTICVYPLPNSPNSDTHHESIVHRGITLYLSKSFDLPSCVDHLRAACEYLNEVGITGKFCITSQFESMGPGLQITGSSFILGMVAAFVGLPKGPTLVGGVDGCGFIRDTEYLISILNACCRKGDVLVVYPRKSFEQFVEIARSRKQIKEYVMCVKFVELTTASRKDISCFKFVGHSSPTIQAAIIDASTVNEILGYFAQGFWCKYANYLANKYSWPVYEDSSSGNSNSCRDIHLMMDSISSLSSSSGNASHGDNSASAISTWSNLNQVLTSIAPVDDKKPVGLSPINLDSNILSPDHRTSRNSLYLGDDGDIIDSSSELRATMSLRNIDHGEQHSRLGDIKSKLSSIKLQLSSNKIHLITHNFEPVFLGEFDLKELEDPIKASQKFQGFMHDFYLSKKDPMQLTQVYLPIFQEGGRQSGKKHKKESHDNPDSSNSIVSVSASVSSNSSGNASVGSGNASIGSNSSSSSSNNDEVHANSSNANKSSEAGVSPDELNCADFQSE